MNQQRFTFYHNPHVAAGEPVLVIMDLTNFKTYEIAYEGFCYNPDINEEELDQFLKDVSELLNKEQ